MAVAAACSFRIKDPLFCIWGERRGFMAFVLLKKVVIKDVDVRPIVLPKECDVRPQITGRIAFCVFDRHECEQWTCFDETLVG